MADNYLEKRMEEHRSGKSQAYRPKLTPSGQRPGTVTYRLGQRRVFVTGGAHGIGRAVVKAFCNAGCRVAFCDIDETLGTETARACGARFIPLDVTDSKALKKCMEDLMYEWGDLDIVVNNVGVGCFKPFGETTVEDFDHVMSVNLRPVFVTANTLYLHRRQLAVANPYGRVINIASTRALQSEADTVAYSASKGAIVALTHSLMMSMSSVSVTVNAISPGWILTHEQETLSPEDLSQHPSGRVGTPDDVASMCVFLSLPQSDFINGENIVIDGGMTRKMIYVET